MNAICGKGYRYWVLMLDLRGYAVLTLTSSRITTDDAMRRPSAHLPMVSYKLMLVSLGGDIVVNA